METTKIKGLIFKTVYPIVHDGNFNVLKDRNNNALYIPENTLLEVIDTVDRHAVLQCRQSSTVFEVPWFFFEKRNLRLINLKERDLF